MKGTSLIRCLVTIWACSIALISISCTSPTTASEPAENRLRAEKISDLPHPGRSWYKVQFINEQDGWLVQGKELWRTNNGGRNWKLLYSGDSTWDIAATIQDLDFVDRLTGWILASPGGIYKTVDGGITWTRLNDPLPNGTIYSVELLQDGKEAWASGLINSAPRKESAGHFSRDDSNAVILHTIDGGQNWKQQVISTTRTVVDLYFHDGTDGWALGSPGLFRLDKASDLWTSIDFQNNPCAGQTPGSELNRADAFYNPTAIYFLDKNQGWVS
jgi:photosystem II stability/assembly factor-like uncharacterized protein